MDFSDERYTPVGAPVKIEPVVAPELKQLLMRFQSLGQDCEFGLVQRRYQAEPLGLLRWATTPIETLLQLLISGFEGIGEKDRTTLRTAPWGELIIYDEKHGLYSHTFIHEQGVDRVAFLEIQRTRQRFLARALLEDLRLGGKIFVYKCNTQLEHRMIDELADAIWHYQETNQILVVNLAAENQTTPHMEFRGRGLYVAALSKTGPTSVEGGTIWDIAFDEWLSICKKLT